MDNNKKEGELEKALRILASLPTAAQAEQSQSAGAARQGGNTITSPVAYGLFAEVDGKMVLQFPTRATEAECVTDVGMYVFGPKYEVRAIYDAAPLASQSQAAQPTEIARHYEAMREALRRIAQPANAGCGCSFPCRCDTPEAEAIHAGSMRDEASEAFAAAPEFAHIAGTSQATNAQAEPKDWMLRSLVADLLHLLPITFEFAEADRATGNMVVSKLRAILAAPVAKEAPQPESWLAYIDPECENAQDKRLSTVSGFVAGQAFNEICRLLGGRWPDCKMQEEAPKAYRFFMELFGAAPVAPEGATE